MPPKRYARISCPLCRKVFRTRKDKPRTQKQWRVALAAHLILSPDHDMKPEEAKRVVGSVFPG